MRNIFCCKCRYLKTERGTTNVTNCTSLWSHIFCKRNFADVYICCWTVLKLLQIVLLRFALSCLAVNAGARRSLTIAWRVLTPGSLKHFGGILLFFFMFESWSPFTSVVWETAPFLLLNSSSVLRTKKISLNLRSAWGWVDHNWIFIFRWTVPLMWSLAITMLMLLATTICQGNYYIFCFIWMLTVQWYS